MFFLCPICASDYNPPAESCPRCDIPLVPSSLTANHDDSDREPVFVELCRPRAFHIAMLIKQTLEHHGIAVLVQGGYSLSMLPQLAFGGELRVLVDAPSLELAREVYIAYFENEDGLEFPDEEDE